tara:strand:+ start:14936 stop:16804 length:1869 start_codon:yes stop_codon:yes gene_type:complete
MKISIQAFLFINLVFSGFSVLAANNTPNYWNCKNRAFGSWGSIGYYADSCDVDPFVDRNQMKRIYGPVVIPNKGSTAQINKYMSEMYPVVRDVSKFYIQSRKPGVSAAEIKAFQDAIYALVHQESFWSHYRNTSSTNLKMIRGDVGHGHGLMQVDDRHHFVSIKNGVGANLGIHFAYALDIYYQAWQAAPSKSCVSSPSNWLARTRSAYSAYNGGMGSICRWTNPKHTWARNDKNFLDKYNQRQWLKYVADTNRKASINIGCLSQGQENCPVEGGTPPPTPNPAPTPTPTPTPPPVSDVDYAKDVFYKNSKGLFCAYNDDKLLCLPNYRDAACINSLLGRNIQVAVPFKSTYREVPIEVLDRNKICKENIPGLLEIGSSLKVLKNINLRRSPAGSLIKTLKDGSEYQVLDFEVKNDGVQTRFYKVASGSSQGYFYAGDLKNYKEWAVEAQAGAPSQEIAKVGDLIRILNSVGINQRTTPGGKLIQRVPKNTVVKVSEIKFSGSNNYLYYKVSYNGRDGYIYAGQGFPISTYASWAKVEAAVNVASVQQVMIQAPVYYANLMSCDSNGCEKSENFVPGPKMDAKPEDRVLEILQTSSTGWSLVRHPSSGKQGWIQSSDLGAAQ